MSKPISAASVLLARRPGAAEVFAVRRADHLRFMGGYVAFPGGKVGPEDESLPVPTNLSPQAIAAVRELFEETGVLLARRADGSFPTTADGLPDLRRALLAEQIAFADVLRRLLATPHTADLTPAGNLVTPPFSPIRFDTAFFVADLPPGQDAEVLPGELAEGWWRTAEQVLAEWARGVILVSPPTVGLLQAIRGGPVADLPERAREIFLRLDAGQLLPIWFSPGVQMIPLACPQLPPSTHTNAYLVGSGPAYLFDPSPTDAAERDRLFALLDDQQAAGRRLEAVVLTHHHPDHIGAAEVTARRYGVPILAHPATTRLLAGKVRVDGEINEGDRLDLGPCPMGGAWHLEALLTPGHASGHLAFWEPRYRCLLAGDLVSTLSSVVIAPPDGDLSDYLASLRRLQALPIRLLLPAHGSPTARPAEVLSEALAHRARREEQLLQALASGPRSLADLAAELYHGLPPKVMRFAELQVEAGVLKLRREGRAAPDGSAWALVSPDG